MSHGRSGTQHDTGDGTRARSWTVVLVAAAAVAVAVAGVFLWASPRDHVAVPGPDASPEQVVEAYIAAVNARDFDTANAIDARPGSHLGRLSRPMETTDVTGMRTVADQGRAHVVFEADFDGGDGTVEDGWWGYVLERGDDGLWHITDAGVA
jgi:hypothetical protein